METFLDTILKRPELVGLALSLAALWFLSRVCWVLWRTLMAERVAANALQESRISDFRASLDANTRAGMAQAASIERLAAVIAERDRQR